MEICAQQLAKLESKLKVPTPTHHTLNQAVSAGHSGGLFLMFPYLVAKSLLFLCSITVSL